MAEPRQLMRSVDWLIYHPHYRVIVCRSCQRGVTHPGLKSHLSTLHPEISPAERRQLISYYHSLPLILSDSFLPPQQPIIPITHIQVYSDGLQCSQCQYVCRCLTAIKNHCSRAHLWKNPYTRGGSMKQRRSHYYPWTTEVYC